MIVSAIYLIFMNQAIKAAVATVLDSKDVKGLDVRTREGHVILIRSSHAN